MSSAWSINRSGSGLLNEGGRVNEQGWAAAYQRNDDGAAESVREDMLALAALLSPALPEVTGRVRSTTDDPRRELTYALGEHCLSANFDFKQDIVSVRDGLESLASYPVGTWWEWHPDFLAECEDWDSSDQLERFLELTGERCHESGFALISIHTFSDDYDLVVVREADLAERRGEATDRWFQVLRLGIWSKTGRPLTARNLVGRRAVMSEWDRFTEDLATMLRKRIGVDAVLEFKFSETVWVQIYQEGVKHVAVGMELSMYADNDAGELVTEGWTLSDDVWDDDNWWEMPLSAVPGVCDSIARRL
ncbi:DUF6630 family protein, partial [Nocardia sp.]|uniref:DUF6630 family protein n=1 Tax=Nocardia sp. TaxID=1821 RepID=UPI00262C5F2C